MKKRLRRRKRPRIGRASRLGDRTLGHPDPGAVSFSIMMRAFAQCERQRGATALFAEDLRLLGGTNRK